MAGRAQKTAAKVGQKTVRTVGASAGSSGRGRSPQTAVVAVVAAAGIIAWDLGSGRTAMSEQQKLHTFVAFGVGAVVLIGLADALPELGVPLSVLLLLVVAVGRPAAIKGLASLMGGQASGGAAPSPSGGASLHRGGKLPEGGPGAHSTTGGAGK